MCNVCLTRNSSRRFMLGAGLAGLAAAAAMPFAAGVAQAQPARAAETPDAALKLLVDGNARYRVRSDERARLLGQPRRAHAGTGAVCRHSRLRRLARRAGARLRPAAGRPLRGACRRQLPSRPRGLGSLEFGAAVLGTRVIMVLGHTSCGAVNATVDAPAEGQQPARSHRRSGDVHEARHRACREGAAGRAGSCTSARSSPTCRRTSSASPRPSRSSPTW